MAVLLLIALATVLIVTTSSISQIERKAVSNSAKEELAKQNALFALGVAMAQLQSAAGPDQRVTATADILSGEGTLKQPYWTGVWKTGTNALDVGSLPQRTASLGGVNPSASQKAISASWLVSGSQNSTTINPIEWADTSSGLTNSVALALNYGAKSATIRVPLVIMTNTYSMGTTKTNLGGYAYWVSDEGVKAKVSQIDQTLGVDPSADPSASQVHFLSPQANSQCNGILGATNTTDLRGTNYFSKMLRVTTLQSMAFVSSSLNATLMTGTNASKLMADATTYSIGVLSDVRRGGLKKDLTAAFESTTNFNTLSSTYGNRKDQVYTSDSDAGLTTPTIDTGTGANPSMDGLLWRSLFFYYNAYKATMPASDTVSGSPTPTTPTSSGNVAILPQVQTPRIYMLNKAGGESLSGFVPVPIAYRIDIGISSYQDPSPPGNWKIRLHYFPQLVLWNPYAASLQIPNYQFQRGVGAFSTGSTFNAVKVITTSGGITKTNTLNTPPSTFGTYLNQLPSGNRFLLLTKRGDCDVLEPGETRVFALDTNQSSSSIADAGSFTNTPLVCNSNTSSDYSKYTDLCDTQTNDKTATINVSLSDIRLRCQNMDTYIIPSQLKWPYNNGSSIPVTRYQGGGGWDIPADSSTWDSGLTLDQLKWDSSDASNTGIRRLIGFYIRQKGLVPSSVIMRTAGLILKFRSSWEIPQCYRP